ncbi:hypothetical protein NQ315_014371 [Exocentrus adspersus]|uniref:DDE Tnp4 domain-containing protein n=1 Tax=Exocentrus adspersus TaxID=1586481 RepID=A0AAV8V7L9_9CUCU|nr:hypothetical protein NQ315_014371 [Exocentrus adspersus]
MDHPEDIFEDDIDILEILDFGFPRKVYNRSNYFDDMDNLTFFRRFRLYKETVLHLVTLIENELEFPNDMNNSVSPINQLLTCLRFYASAGHLNAVADFMGMDVSTTSRIICRVSEAIARLAPRLINMPVRNDIFRYQTKFHNVAGFPRVIGLVDGTPYQDPVTWCEVMMLKYTGTEKATFLSHLRFRFENDLFLGDSGYALKNYFLTPLANPVTRSEQLYNESLIRTRNIVDRVIGIWKKRFPVLAYGMRIKLETVLTTIVATAVLHNIAREMNEPEPPAPLDIDIDHLHYLIAMGQIPDPPPAANHNVVPNYAQQQLIQHYFNNL